MPDFVPFPEVKIRSIENPNIFFDVHHHRFETLVQGCYRIAQDYRYKESSRMKFQIEQNGEILFDSNKKKVLV